MDNRALTLDPHDPRVIAARGAERELFEHYGLEATDHYVTLPELGLEVRVSEIGTGAPLVIVPGNTGDVFPLASLLAQLTGRRILAINRPGGGLSEGLDHNALDLRPFAANTLDTVLQHFGLEAVDVVAHSMGAHWSLWWAMDRPARVRTLTLLGNPGNVMQGRPPWAIRLLGKSPLSKLLFRLLMPSDKENALRSLRALGHDAASIARLPRALSHAYYYFWRLPHYEVSATSLLQNVAPRIDAAQLGRVSQPTLLLLGTRDTFASVEVGRGIVAALPKGTFHAIEGAGHLPWLEQADECGRRIRAFLAGAAE